MGSKQSLGEEIWDSLVFNPKFKSKDTVKPIFVSWLNNLEAKITEYGRTQEAWRKLLNRNILIDKPRGQDWKVALYSVVGLRKCSMCKELVSIEDFNKGQHNCKKCLGNYREKNRDLQKLRAKQHYQDNKSSYKARAASRRAHIATTTPSWQSLKEIEEFYSKCPKGYHVDHIIPLQGELVSGLHVISNLQYLEASKNLAKGNSFDIERFNNEF